MAKSRKTCKIANPAGKATPLHQLDLLLVKLVSTSWDSQKSSTLVQLTKLV